ncbi:Farnesyl pyrophosphate synthase [Folsomia candida]|uniref:Farnesyl pyrophosphate synthase n=1 Tax=Folsomia candida TaxID=158441 RepID=A0A226D6L9_FOLCA|nr:Farnesyl pyrophosphate synthase [Folsomia candida]
MSRGVRRKSMSVAEEDAFLQKFDEMVEEITSGGEYDDIAGAVVRRVVTYNVPEGVVSFLRFGPWLKPEPEDTNLRYIVGWCIEILLAAFLMSDDLMDNSETRRGKPCWYLVDNNSDLAINDSFLLSGLITIFLDKHFFDKRYYSDLVWLFHDVYLKTILG